MKRCQGGMQGKKKCQGYVNTDVAAVEFLITVLLVILAK